MAHDAALPLLRINSLSGGSVETNAPYRRRLLAPHWRPRGAFAGTRPSWHPCNLPANAPAG